MKGFITVLVILCCSSLYAKNSTCLKEEKKEDSTKPVSYTEKKVVNFDYFQKRKRHFLEQKKMKWTHKNPTYYV